MQKINAKWHSSIKEINEDKWNKLFDFDSIPFYQWKWLYALEKSNSIIPKYGWQPLYLSLYKNNELISVAPLYLKGHSYGEFIFDQQFVQLAKELNLNYYPKLVGMSPVSPVEGYKFLFLKGEDNEELTQIMMYEIDNFCKANEILSCNFLYVDQTWKLLAEKTECAPWINQSSLWNSGDNKNFPEYLSRFKANQRRNIKRERKKIRDFGLNICVRNGSSIEIQDMKLMYHFYQKHCSRWGIWGSKYLSEEFFKELASSKLRNQIVLFSAHKEQDINPLAMSLCITNKEMLWGRYWGSDIEINDLHFELCYYSPIQWCLENGIKSFDPGAGGSHKLRRGFEAKPNTSLHRWYDKTMEKLMRSWLPKVNQLMIEKIKATNNELPFKLTQPKLSSVE